MFSGLKSGFLNPTQPRPTSRAAAAAPSTPPPPLRSGTVEATSESTQSAAKKSDGEFRRVYLSAGPTTQAQPAKAAIESGTIQEAAKAAVKKIEKMQQDGVAAPEVSKSVSGMLKYLLKKAAEAQTVDKAHYPLLGRDPHLALKNFHMMTSILFYSVMKAITLGFEHRAPLPPMLDALNLDEITKNRFTYELMVASRFENINCICFPDGGIVAKIPPSKKEEEGDLSGEALFREYMDGLPPSAYLDLFLTNFRFNYCRLDAFHPGGLGPDPRFTELFPLEVRFNPRLPLFGNIDFLNAHKSPAPKPDIKPTYIPLYALFKKYRCMKLLTFQANQPVGILLVDVTAEWFSKIYDLLHKKPYDTDQLLDVLIEANKAACIKCGIAPDNIDPEARLINGIKSGLDFDHFEKAYSCL